MSVYRVGMALAVAAFIGEICVRCMRRAIKKGQGKGQKKEGK